MRRATEGERHQLSTTTRSSALAAHSCLGFTVQAPDGTLGAVEAVAERERALAVGSASATLLVPVADVELVDTASARILLRRPPAPSAHVVTAADPGGSCPSDFLCVGCGYGVAAGHLPPTCPMCGGHRWRPAHARPAA